MLLGRNRAATSCMDVSDGLADCVRQVSEASGLESRWMRQRFRSRWRSTRRRSGEGVIRWSWRSAAATITSSSSRSGRLIEGGYGPFVGKLEFCR